MLELTAGRGYRTSLDRAGLALATGGLLGGLLTVVLAAMGDEPSVLALVFALMIGTVITAMAIVAIAGPLWALCHAFGKRGAVAAFVVGVVSGFTLFLGGQTYGFGLFDMPATDMRTLMFRWSSGIATSLILSVIAGGIGLAMWRVAYRRV